MRAEPRQSKQQRLKAFADRVDVFVVEQWLLRRRDAFSTAKALGLEPTTIGAVVGDQLRYDDRADR